MPDRYLGREDDPALDLSRAQGSHLFSARGSKYIDFVSGWCVGNLGWNHPVPARRRDRDGRAHDGQPRGAHGPRRSPSGYFRQRLAGTLLPEIEASIRGPAIGIDVGEESVADAIQEACMRRGLVVTTQGARVMLLPALTIERDAAVRGLDILAASLKPLR